MFNILFSQDYLFPIVHSGIRQSHDANRGVKCNMSILNDNIYFLSVACSVLKMLVNKTQQITEQDHVRPDIEEGNRAKSSKEQQQSKEL
jgi:hypothetical protein